VVPPTISNVMTIVDDFALFRHLITGYSSQPQSAHDFAGILCAYSSGMGVTARLSDDISADSGMADYATFASS